MPRNRILTVMIILAAMTLIWAFSSESSKRLDPGNTTANPTVNREPAALVVRSEPEDITRTQQQEHLQNLQRQLSLEQQKLQAQGQTLVQMRQSQQSLEGSVSYSPQIYSRDLEIENVMDEMAEYRRAEEELNRVAEVTLNNQDNAARLAREQVDTQIQDLEQDIRRNQNELSYWQLNPLSDQVLQQPPQVVLLQSRLAEQQQQLQDLRLERLNISATVMGNTENVHNLIEMARNELRMSTAQAQGQIFALRSEMAQMQNTQFRAQSRLRDLRTQISQAEKIFETQNQQVKALEAEIQRQQSELR